MTLENGIRASISKLGLEGIKTQRLVNMLSDLRAFGKPAYRRILREMIKAGKTEEMYDATLNFAPDRLLIVKAMVHEVNTVMGFEESLAQYVVGSLALGLGWTSEEIGREIEGVVERINDETLNQEEDAKPSIRFDLEIAPPPPSDERTYEAAGISFTLRRVRGGAFAMGATPEQGLAAAFDEKPSVEVTLYPFFIATTPVTQQLWEAVMGANPSHFPDPQRPVERVSWEECQVFLERLNGMTGLSLRLPTEAEWELAARGGVDNPFPTRYSGADDDQLDLYAWYKDNAHGSTQPVGQLAPNLLGLYDMSGNVAEWCSDWYFNSYAIGLSHTNPQGPTTGTARVVRGGSYNDKAIACRTTKRNSLNPSYRSKQIGLRLALDD